MTPIAAKFQTTEQRNFVRDESLSTQTRIIFLVLAVISLAPIACPFLPAAMVDYPNHLARMFVLARDGTANPHPVYQAAWALYPNLAMDLLVPRLGRIVGIETATRLFYLASQLLIVTGAIALERAVKGRVAFAGFFALIFLHSLPFAWGFMNFQFALGGALWALAGAFAIQDRSSFARFAYHAIAIAALFIAHIFALGLYGFTIGVHELWRARKQATAISLTRFATLALPTLALIATMVANRTATTANELEWHFLLKAFWLFHIVSGYSFALSIAAVLTLILALRWAARQGALHFEQSGLWLLAAFTLLYCAMPFRLLSGTFVDVRVLIGAALILPAFLSLSLPNRRTESIARAIATTIIVLNVAVVAWVWNSYRSDYTAAMQSFQLIPKQAAVLVGHSGTADDPPLLRLTEYPIYHVPVLAVAYADAFVPNLFVIVGQQPVSPRPQWRRLSVPTGSPLPIALLKSIAEHRDASAAPPHVANWHNDFDYLYVVGQPIPNPLPTILQELTAAPRFTLYRIRKAATPKAAS